MADTSFRVGGAPPRGKAENGRALTLIGPLARQAASALAVLVGVLALAVA